ncbi:RICIN domain-containing protein [Streptomyces avidinii]|uniref:Ricin B lectin domain-containing protein n=1 Tax=Streptomyces avidinii TaxID=1895 RepID=A0ABS4L708_STRAV|nr:RICIN domain-containing protein [Streptomyces avidinii]MBP2037869.1 hypothetical protein [Streptomyces avidinii]GGZ08081.1 hypothetical protein GCM10010343_37820 [Streptomyces avidinii]
MSTLKRFIGLGGTLVTALTLAVVPTPASAGTVFDDFRNANSGKCLEVADWSTANGAPVRQWDCSGGNNQKWTWNSETLTMVNRHSGKCLEIADWSMADGAPARQWDCSGGNNQKWNWMLQPGGYVQMVVSHSGKSLEVIDWSTANGAAVRQWSGTSGANQRWY